MLAESRRWIQSSCTDARQLHLTVGASREELEWVADAGLLPQPTYRISETGIVSPVFQLGTLGAVETQYFGPAVVSWLCRAVQLVRCGESPEPALKRWFTEDLRRALLRNAADVRSYRWPELFDADLRLDESGFDALSDALWVAWFRGGWAVCLNRWDGHHIITKEVEMNRIAALAEDIRRGAARTRQSDLLDAMLRFDSVVRPFAPFERSMSSRGRVIDAIAAEFALSWHRICI